MIAIIDPIVAEVLTIVSVHIVAHE